MARRTAKPRVVRFAANPGAQLDFCVDASPYPGMVSGFGGGKSWAGSAKLVAGHIAFPGTDSLAVAPTFPNARQIVIPALVERLTEAGIAHTVDRSHFEIRTPGLGSTILVHSGINAERITGFEVGRTWIDEPARIPDYEEAKRNVWIAALGRTRDHRVPASMRFIAITGTHEGRGTWVHRKWEQDRKPGYSLHRGSTFENPYMAEKAEELVAELDADLARQYVFGGAVEESTAVLGYDAILAAQSPTASAGVDWLRLERVGRPLFAGMDIGRAKSLTVAWVVSVQGDGSLRTEAIEVLRAAPFAEQDALIDRLAALPGFARIAIDSTYNPQTAESAVERYGPRVEAVQFTPAVKADLCEGLARAIQSRTLAIPTGDDIVDDLYSVKRVSTSTGTVRYVAPYSADGHADRFFAAALAVHAAADCAPVSFTYGAAESRRIGRSSRSVRSF